MRCPTCGALLLGGMKNCPKCERAKKNAQNGQYPAAGNVKERLAWLSEQNDTSTLLEYRDVPLDTKYYDYFADEVLNNAIADLEDRVRRRVYSRYGYSRRNAYSHFGAVAILMNPKLDDEFRIFHKNVMFGSHDHERDFVFIQTKYWADVQNSFEALMHKFQDTGIDSLQYRRAVNFYADDENASDLTVKSLMQNLRKDSHNNTRVESYKEIIFSIWCGEKGQIYR